MHRITGVGRYFVNIPAPAGTFARLDPEPRRTVVNEGAEVASVMIVSAPRTSGYEPLEWA